MPSASARRILRPVPRLPALILLLLVAGPLAARIPADLESELARIEQEGSFDIFRDREVRRALEEAAKADEVALRARMLRMPEGAARQRALRLLGEVTAARSAESALSLLAEVPLGERAMVAESAFTTLAQGSVPAARALAARLSDPVVRERAELAVALVLARTDGPAAAAMVEGQSPSARRRVWRQVAQSWPLKDGRGLLRWVAGLPDLGEPERASLISAWAYELCRKEPSLAKSVLPMFPDEVRPMYCSMVASRLSKDDLAGTLAWMARLPTQDDRSQALVGLLDEWAAADLESARLAVAEWPDPAVRSRLHGILAWEWAKRDAMACLAWASTLEPSLRHEASARAINQLAYQDESRARKALMGLPAGPDRDKLAARYVENRTGSAALADWAAAYPEPAAARKMVRRAVFGWAYLMDSAAELDQLESHVLGLGDLQMRAAAARGALDGVSGQVRAGRKPPDPGLLLRLVEALPDPDERRARAQTLSSLWSSAYPDDPRRPFERLLRADPPR